MTALVALPFVGIQQRAASGNVFSDEGMARPRVRAVTDPPTVLARVPRDDADERETIVRIGTMSLAFIGTSTGWIGGIAMGCTFSPRVLIQLIWMRCPRVWSCFRERPNSRARRTVGSPLAIPRTSSTGVTGRCRGSRRRSQSAGYDSHRNPDSERPEVTVVAEPAPLGMATAWANQSLRVEITLQTRGDRCCRPRVLRLRSQSRSYHTTSSTLAIHEPYFQLSAVMARACRNPRSGLSRLVQAVYSAH
jgi:hypothetical protein